MEVRGALRDTGGLLHRVGHDHDGVVLPQLVDELLDARGGDRVEGRAGLVHQDHLGAHRDGPRNAQPLLLSAGQPGAGLLEAILDLVPQAGLLEAALDDRVGLALAVGQSVDPRSVCDVVVDGLRKWIGLLEHHADTGAKLHHVEAGIVDIFPVELDAARHPADVDGIVHPVEAAQEGRLAAARGADHRQHLVRADVEVDVLDPHLVAVHDADGARRHARMVHGDLTDRLDVVRNRLDRYMRRHRRRGTPCG